MEIPPSERTRIESNPENPVTIHEIRARPNVREVSGPIRVPLQDDVGYLAWRIRGDLEIMDENYVPVNEILHLLYVRRLLYPKSNVRVRARIGRDRTFALEKDALHLSFVDSEDYDFLPILVQGLPFSRLVIETADMEQQRLTALLGLFRNKRIIELGVVEKPKFSISPTLFPIATVLRFFDNSSEDTILRNIFDDRAREINWLINTRDVINVVATRGGLESDADQVLTLIQKRFPKALYGDITFDILLHGFPSTGPTPSEAQRIANLTSRFQARYPNIRIIQNIRS